MALTERKNGSFGVADSTMCKHTLHSRTARANQALVQRCLRSNSPGANWRIAITPVTSNALDKDKTAAKGAMLGRLKWIKARIRVEIEKPSCIITRQFGCTWVKYTV